MPAPDALGGYNWDDDDLGQLGLAPQVASTSHAPRPGRPSTPQPVPVYTPGTVPGQRSGSVPPTPQYTGYGPAGPAWGAQSAGVPELGSRLGRLAANLLDGFIIWIAAMGAFLAFGLLAQRNAEAGFALAGMGLLGVAAVSALYTPVLLRCWNGQTVGKRVLGLRVVRSDGSQVLMGRVLVRVLTPAVLAGVCVAAGTTITVVMGSGGSAFAYSEGGTAAGPLLGLVVILLGYLLNPMWCLFDKRKQCLHDKAADTIVVRSR